MLVRPIPLQSGIVYGPLKSRRFGVSLGINFLPRDQKICNFDCVYCQYGQSQISKRAHFPDLHEIEEEVATHLYAAKNYDSPIDCLMIAGNGEPTLHPLFSEVIDSLVSLRNKILPHLPIGILSNSSTCHQSEIQEALSKLDGCFMKLDAGGEKTFQAINRPAGHGHCLKRIAEGLRDVRGVTLQSLFIEGSFNNISDGDVEEWGGLVRDIGPRSVQIYTVERPTACRGVLPVPKSKLENIAEFLTTKMSVPSMVYN